LLFRSGSFNNYVETIFRIWTFALRWKRKNYNKAPLAFLSDLFYSEQNGHPMREAIEKFLVHFNDYWVENMHSKIRATTSPTDNASNIQKQAYLLGMLINTVQVVATFVLIVAIELQIFRDIQHFTKCSLPPSNIHTHHGTWNF